MTTQSIRDFGHHREVWNLLPWYVNGTLDIQETTLVETHLTGCTACQTELVRCRATANVVRDVQDGDWSPSPANFDRLMAQLDGEVDSAAARSWWARCLDGFAQFRERLQSSPRPMQWTLAMQSALVLVLGVALVWRTASVTHEEPYRTLTRPDTATSTTGLRFTVVFAETITEQELRALLLPLHASIVRGPSELGVYTLEIPVDAAPAGRAAVLQQLRAQAQVRLAEPVITP